MGKWTLAVKSNLEAQPKIVPASETTPTLSHAHKHQELILARAKADVSATRPKASRSSRVAGADFASDGHRDKTAGARKYNRATAKWLPKELHTDGPKTQR